MEVGLISSETDDLIASVTDALTFSVTEDLIASVTDAFTSSDTEDLILSETEDLMLSVGLMTSVVVTDSVDTIFSVIVILSGLRLAGSSVIRKVAVDTVI